MALLIILGLGILIAYLMGIQDKIPWKKTLGCYVYSVFKQGLVNFQYRIDKSLEDTLNLISNLIDKVSAMAF